MERLTGSDMNRLTVATMQVEALRKQAADAQATIAALQAVIDDHHRLVREMDVRLNGEQGAAKQASLCDIVSQLVALQARVQELEQWVQDQSTANLETMRHTDEMQSRAMEAEHQLTQRTAERDTARRRVDELEAREVDVVTLREDLEQRTAELERVRLLSSHNERRFELLEEKYKELRTLVLTLPKVDGEIVVNGRTIDEQYPTLSWQIASTGMDEFTNAIAAILKHRQGMDG